MSLDKFTKSELETICDMIDGTVGPAPVYTMGKPHEAQVSSWIKWSGKADTAAAVRTRLLGTTKEGD